MIKVTQTKVVVRNSKGDVVVNGNCFAAVIASMLEKPIEMVPNVEVFFGMENSYWQEVMLSFLSYHGWEWCTDDRFRCFHFPPEQLDISPTQYLHDRELLKDQYYFVCGPSARGVNHIVIYQNGVMVHDPHPSREGILQEDTFESLIKIEK